MARDGERKNGRGELVGFHETRHLEHGGVHRLEIKVGKRLEITRDEHRELGELGAWMRTSSMSGHPGWLEEYVRAHTAAAKVLRRIISRAHT